MQTINDASALEGASQNRPLFFFRSVSCGVLSVLMLACGFFSFPVLAQGVSECTSYDRWSLAGAFTSLDLASLAVGSLPDCYGDNMEVCRGLDEEVLNAKDHLDQIFLGATTFQANNCKHCGMATMIEYASLVAEWGNWLYANGYGRGTSYRNTYDMFLQWDAYPFCSSSRAAPAEICNDSYDNDGDGYFDCDDPDCASQAICRPDVPPATTTYYRIQVSGSGYIPHYAGGSYITSGSHEFVLEVKASETLNDKLDAVYRQLVGSVCDVDIPPVPGLQKKPSIWEGNPSIVYYGPYMKSAEAREGGLSDTWKHADKDGPSLGELRKRHGC